MLVLTRKTNEQILIPDVNLAIRVVEVRGGAVRLGVQAPKDLQVIREELRTQHTVFGRLLRKKSPWHAIRNELQRVALSMALLRSNVNNGADRATIDANLRTLEDIFEIIRQKTDDSETTEGNGVAKVGKRHALVVEDDRQERELLTELLRSAGIEVTAVPDGHAALEAMSKTPHDIVLLDMGLPDIDGADVISRIRSQPALAQQKIWVISGRKQAKSPVTTADRWFEKPVRPEMLLEQLACVG